LQNWIAVVYTSVDTRTGWSAILSDIIVVIRNEQGAGMSSIEGDPVIVLLTSEGIAIDQQPVMLRSAVAIFANLPAGFYTVIARHPLLSPTEARQDIVLQRQQMSGIKFIYAEPDRQLVRIELQEESLNG
jgi:hypothetical protein